MGGRCRFLSVSGLRGGVVSRGGKCGFSSVVAVVLFLGDGWILAIVLVVGGASGVWSTLYFIEYWCGGVTLGWLAVSVVFCVKLVLSKSMSMLLISFRKASSMVFSLLMLGFSVRFSLAIMMSFIVKFSMKD